MSPKEINVSSRVPAHRGTRLSNPAALIWPRQLLRGFPALRPPSGTWRSPKVIHIFLTAGGQGWGARSLPTAPKKEEPVRTAKFSFILRCLMRLPRAERALQEPVGGRGQGISYCVRECSFIQLVLVPSLSDAGTGRNPAPGVLRNAQIQTRC